MKGYKKIKKAFTLVELVVSMVISTLVLSFIFLYLGNIIGTVEKAEKEVVALEIFYDFVNKVDNYNNIYSTGFILSLSSTGSNVFMLQDELGRGGIIFGPVGVENKKLNIDKDIYEKKGIGFRKVSELEIDDINNDNTVVLDYMFHDNQIFRNIYLQDLMIEKYNSGKVYDLKMIVDMNFNEELIGESRTTLPKDLLKMFNFNF